MEPIRVLLVDDQCGVRKGLKMRLALEPDIRVAGEAASGDEALLTVRSHPVDVVVMDYEMPGMTGIETVEAFERNGVRAAVVILSIHDNQMVRKAASEAGTRFVAKHEPGERLISAIREAASGLHS